MGRQGMANLAWSLGVLAVLGTLAFGLPAVDAALPAARPVPADQRYPLSRGVSVVPPPHAELDVTATGPGKALFLLGGVRYLLVVTPFDGSLDDAVAQLRQKITANRGYQVTGPETATVTRQGVPGRQGGYTSPGREGRYAAYLHAGTAVEVTIAGADLELRAALPALAASVATLAVP
jgi:hypothetical protein